MASFSVEEVLRVEEVGRYRFLVGRRNEMLDDICTLAKGLFAAHYAAVSLVGERDLWLLTPEPDAPASLPRSEAFCSRTILGEEVVVSNRADADPAMARFWAQCRDEIQFYAGAPLTMAEGSNVGALCILDRKRRPFGDGDKEHLRKLAVLAANELQRQRTLLELRDQQALVSQAAALARVGSWDLNFATGTIVWSEEMYRILQMDPALPPLTPEEFADRMVEPADREWLANAMQNAVSESRAIQIVVADGARRWINLIGEVEHVDGVAVRMLGSIQDVTELHEGRLRIEHLAYRDSLTGLPNRALFTKQFQHEIEQARVHGTKVGLILLDLDHFKDVNDTLGHDAGDVLLQSVAERMTRAYRRTDTVARLGGDEFAIILPDIRGVEDMTRPTEVLMALLRHPVEHGDKVFTISASVGGAVYPSDDDDAAQLLKSADIALYEAKAAGRNRMVTYKPAMRAVVDKRMEMLREVRLGLSRQEFVLYYQPVVNIAPEAVTGFEALMRWNHPTRGVLAPDAFMAAFEHQDLAAALCDVTLDGALSQMRAWIEQDVPFGRVAINVSAAQFRAPDLADLIERRLKHWGVPANRLTIEVTENVYMGWGSDVVGDTVRRLHDSGVLIALDDFGTGYASLANLKQFPIDRLKIDKSFVQNIDDQAIVRAVITLGASLGMKVVAEGVEGLDQLAFLERSGCDQVQGYHFARPMPGAEVPAFLRRFAASEGIARSA